MIFIALEQWLVSAYTHRICRLSAVCCIVSCGTLHNGGWFKKKLCLWFWTEVLFFCNIIWSIVFAYQ